VDSSAVLYGRPICCSSMALPEIKYTKVKTPLYTELRLSFEDVQMKSYSGAARIFQRRVYGGGAAAPQAGF